MENYLCLNGIAISAINEKRTLNMELSKWIWILSFMAIVCHISNGNAYPILGTEEDDLFLNEGNEPMERQDIQSIFDPESELNGREDDSIANFLKRNGLQLSEGYQRYPRIKDRFIIPFYSYGNKQGYIRPKPKLFGRPRAYFGYNPWIIESSQYGNKPFSKGAYKY